MSIDKLQERIRKLKNPSVIEFCVTKEVKGMLGLEMCRE